MLDDTPRSLSREARPSRDWTFCLLGILAVAAGTIAAVRLAWLCDDAFISMRYALNLSRGSGLVFNVGERVEGFSNLIWTLLLALAFELGIEPEHWAIVLGVAAYAGTLASLAWYAYRLRSAGAQVALPFASILAASHPDLAVFATGGLETSFFTFLVVAAFLSLSLRRDWRGGAGGGLLLALASLTRPDGLLLAVIAAPFVYWRGVPRLRSTCGFAVAFALVWIPATVARVAYYESFFPNTYYAKSASLAWWSQGLRYALLYFERYPLLALALPLALGATTFELWDAARRKAFLSGDGPLSKALLALAFTLSYGLYVTRVGGDFMFARLLIPVTPLLLILLETVSVLWIRRGVLQIMLAVAVATAFASSSSPVGTDYRKTWGIADERAYYDTHPIFGPVASRARGEALRPFFRGLQIRMAFLGGEARLVYYADPAVAVESHTGLTDRHIARQPLSHRGRIGHEKLADTEYLLGERDVFISFHPNAGRILKLDTKIPNVPIVLGGVRGRLLRWDPEAVAELRRRGAFVADFPEMLDRYLAAMSSLPQDRVRKDFHRFERFYFQHVADEVRSHAFDERLAVAPL